LNISIIKNVIATKPVLTNEFADVQNYANDLTVKERRPVITFPSIQFPRHLEIPLIKIKSNVTFCCCFQEMTFSMLLKLPINTFVATLLKNANS